MKNFFKKTFYLLQLFDGIWSVPLAFTTFWLVGLMLQTYFGFGTGTYDMGFIQPLFLAAAIVIGATNFATVGIFFTFRGLFRYIYGKKQFPTRTSKEDFAGLTIGQRFLVAFGTFLYFVTAVIVVYLKLV